MMNTGEPDATEIGHVRFGKRSSEKELPQSYLAGDLLHFTPGSGGAGGCDSRRQPIKKSKWRSTPLLLAESGQI